MLIASAEEAAAWARRVRMRQRPRESLEILRFETRAVGQPQADETTGFERSNEARLFDENFSFTDV